ncbi:P-II family nitrogen regulator [Desulfovermiculus halophilus]|jgi:nitrogen regulatory protein PII|uniref:P-II family nitrogen regulator n=1 Tax=Desulfovermiculus halophilus TaxID=339722 RepID=UPI000481136A|nr:P-II family nitrogen regulator [Desulfovermiculus halophilus]
MNRDTFDLIVTIVNKNMSADILQASKEAGAEGGTIVYGRGTGIHENKTLFGIPIEPEKELILTIVPQDITNQVQEAIIRAGELDQPGAGILFVLELKNVAGICHLCMEESEQSLQGSSDE